MLQELEPFVVELYREADRAVNAYREITGLHCPDGCLQCCFSEKVEATVLEMVPVAFHLFRTSQAALIIKRLEGMDNRSRQCILFRPDLQATRGKGCSQYPYRALVCRLFGFAGNLDRHGLPQLARCRHMGSPHSGPGQNKAQSGDAPLPLFHGFGIALTAIHPDLGTMRKPINHALGEALAKVGLLLDLQSVVPGSAERVDLPPDSPAPQPPILMRKAA